MNQEKPHTDKRAGYSGIFLERSGVDAYQLAKELVEAPAQPLDEEEKQVVYAYEDELLSFPVADRLTLKDVLNEPLSPPNDAPLFFGEAFVRGEVMLEGRELPVFSTGDEAYNWVTLTAKNGTLTAKELLALAKSSSEYYFKVMQDALVSGEKPADVSIDNQSIVIDPWRFMRLVENTKAVRAHLLEERAQTDNVEPLDGAKRAYNDIYLARVNEMIATQVPLAYTLVEQSRQIGDIDTEATIRRLIPPSFERTFNDESRRQQLFERLDYLRNGIGYDKEGRATAVSGQIPEFATQEDNRSHEALFSDNEREALKHYKVSPERMLEIFTEVVAKAGLLSNEDPSTWVPERPSRAGDGLFQVVTNPGKDTFEVKARSGAYLVASTPRSLYDVIAVGGLHELEHINQALADDAIAEKVKIARLKPKRISALREAGANTAQRKHTMEVFGEAKPYARTYAAALESLEKGEDFYAAVKAFYDEKCRVFPGINKKDAAREAADRVLRLVRLGGVNSEAMAYAEEAILAEELAQATPEERHRAVAVTSLDLVDQARLHRFDLLPEPKTASIEWKDIVLEIVKPDIDKAIKQ